MISSKGYETLISVDELQSIISDNDLIVLDARFNLADPDQGRRAYDESHIPRAVYIHLDEQLSAPITASSGRHPLPDFDQLANWLFSIGYQQDKQVVVYDDMAGAMAARCWWLLRLLGHKSVAVLDGGFSAWINTGYGVEADAFEPNANWLPAKMQRYQLDHSAVISTDQINDNLATQHWLLIDARTSERFRGEQEPIDPVAGHIPGAVNRPLPNNLDNGQFKSAAQLRSEWLALLQGKPAAEVVHMCGSGVTACHNLLAMEHAGLTGSKVYGGSWSEWIRDPERPIATT